MPRQPRLHFPGALYHVLHRGNNRQNIFFNELDHRDYLALLKEEGVERFGHRIHAFCLMPNHVHLAIQVGEISLSRIMHNLLFRYARRINHHRDQVGHLFQRRYQAILVEVDSYLFELVRYIHLNPVRAGLARHPTAHPWNSHRAYLGLETLSWLTTDWVLQQFHTKRSQAQERYAAYIQDGMDEPCNAQCPNGGDDDRSLEGDSPPGEVVGQTDHTLAKTVTLEAIIEAVCQEYGIIPSLLGAPGKHRKRSEARAIAALIVLEAPHLSLTRLSALWNRDHSTLSEAITKLVDNSSRDPDLAARLQMIRWTLITSHRYS